MVGFILLNTCLVLCQHLGIHKLSAWVYEVFISLWEMLTIFLAYNYTEDMYAFPVEKWNQLEMGMSKFVHLFFILQFMEQLQGSMP
jgi:hypothetical protein